MSNKTCDPSWLDDCYRFRRVAPSFRGNAAETKDLSINNPKMLPNVAL
mgnify:FL=1